MSFKSRTPILFLLVSGFLACRTKDQPQPSDHATTSKKPAKDPAELKWLAEHYPLFGFVTGLQIILRETPDPEGKPLGWLRMGNVIRLKTEKKTSATCASGWYEVHPRGWVCSGEGVSVKQSDPAAEATDLSSIAASRDQPLPYVYYAIKDPLTPEYHRLPSRDEQREAMAFRDAALALRAKDAPKAFLMLKGELKNAPPRPSFVRAWLERGFFVAGAAVEVRASRRFVRTVRGRYLLAAALEEKAAGRPYGVTLDQTHQLPIAWAVRSVVPQQLRTRSDGTQRYVDMEGAKTYARGDLVPWTTRTRVGGDIVHQLKEGGFVKLWFLGIAEKIPPPAHTGKEDTWVHVDLSEQTLVVYRGTEPIFATLVSTGLDAHPTPIGEFSIRSKLVTATMSDIGQDAPDTRYSIEDVPWTQYFSGSIALHGAFWHDRFGLQRSHGCINISPEDARTVFLYTQPEVPEGWHGVSTDKTGFKASKVVVTQ